MGPGPAGREGPAGDGTAHLSLPFAEVSSVELVSAAGRPSALSVLVFRTPS